MKMMNRRITKMDAKLLANYRFLTRIANHQTRKVLPRAIPYGSYSETAAASAMSLIGLAVFAATMFSILIKFRII
jgi:hypothetical protein